MEGMTSNLKNISLDDVIISLCESEISPQDWRWFYEKLVRNLPRIRDKWAFARFAYKTLNKKYDYIEVSRVVWTLIKIFDQLFEKTMFFDFYILTEDGIEFFKALMNPLEAKEVEPKNQNDLLKWLQVYRNRGVRA